MIEKIKRILCCAVFIAFGVATYAQRHDGSACAGRRADCMPVRSVDISCLNLFKNGSASMSVAAGCGKFGQKSKNGKIFYTNTYENALLSVIDLDGLVVLSGNISTESGIVALSDSSECIMKLVTPENAFK